MKPSDVLDIVIHSILFNRRIIIAGEPGCSKTETNKLAVKIIKDVALGNMKTGKYYDKKILSEADYWKDIEMVMQHPVTSDPTDYKGLPFGNNGFADFIPFALLKRMIETETPLVINYDDLGLSTSAVQGALMQIILERKINDKKISDHVRFVAATNRRKDNAGVGNIITPLLNRFDTIINMEINHEDWCKWAISAGMPIELIQFIRFRPDLLSTFKAEKDIKNFSSPRSCESLGKWLNEGVTNLEVWIGCVGEAFAVEFKAFYDVFKNLAGLPELVLNNPKSAPIPEKMDVVYALCAVLAKRVNDVNIDNLFVYMERMKKEWGTVIASSIIENKPELINTKAFIDWQLKNADVI